MVLQRTLIFFFCILKSLDEDTFHGSIPSSEVLSLNEEPDSTFLREMAALVDAAEKVCLFACWVIIQIIK